jgi:PHD/YefM family antitoxin component YafN of YafNO toxin-antitoxin module
LNRRGSAAVRQARRHGQVCVTDRGQAVAFILSAEKVEAMLETLEVMSDPKAMAAIRNYEAGRARMKDVSCLDDE